MHGNVYEMSADYYAEWYSGVPVVNQKGPVSGPYTVIRDGGWHSSGKDLLRLRSAHRTLLPMGTSQNNVGFRVALVPLR